MWIHDKHLQFNEKPNLYSSVIYIKYRLWEQLLLDKKGSLKDPWSQGLFDPRARKSVETAKRFIFIIRHTTLSPWFFSQEMKAVAHLVFHRLERGRGDTS